MVSSKPGTFKLTAPDGTEVVVTGETRRDVLLTRGYTEGKQAEVKATSRSAGAAEVKRSS